MEGLLGLQRRMLMQISLSTPDTWVRECICWIFAIVSRSRLAVFSMVNPFRQNSGGWDKSVRLLAIEVSIDHRLFWPRSSAEEMYRFGLASKRMYLLPELYIWSAPLSMGNSVVRYKLEVMLWNIRAGWPGSALPAANLPASSLSEKVFNAEVCNLLN